MQKTDFVTAFGRLLRDGALRDAYAKDAAGTLESLGLAVEERAALLDLDPSDLEMQAEVLVRKRFAAVARLLPQTIAKVGSRAWPLFAEFGRKFWPGPELREFEDASNFCDYLSSGPRLAAVISAAERNRARFAIGRAYLSIHLVRDALVGKRQRECFQILWRLPGGHWREVLLYFGL